MIQSQSQGRRLLSFLRWSLFSSSVNRHIWNILQHYLHPGLHSCTWNKKNIWLINRCVRFGAYLMYPLMRWTLRIFCLWSMGWTRSPGLSCPQFRGSLKKLCRSSCGVCQSEQSASMKCRYIDDDRACDWTLNINLSVNQSNQGT